MIRALEVSEALQAALVAVKHAQMYGPVLAFDAVESYFDAARVLDRRLGLNQVVGTAVELTGLNADGRLARPCRSPPSPGRPS